MTAAEERRLSSQVWERESDGARYTGFTLAVMLRHWKVKLEDLLNMPIGKGFTDPIKQCSPYRRVA